MPKKRMDYSSLSVAALNHHLLESIKQGQLQKFKQIVKAVNLDIHSWRDSAQGESLVVMLSQHGQVPMLQWCLKKRGLILEQDSRKALDAAINAHQLKAVMFFRGKIPFIQKNHEGKTPLDVAEEHKIEPIISVIKKQVAIETKRWEKLSLAITENNLNKLKALKVKSLNFSLKNEEGSTALHWAARNGHVAVMSYLLSQGAAVEAKTNDGWTALYYAAGNGHLEIVTYLLSQGAAVEAKTNDGATALHCAAFNGHLEIVTYLLSQGVAVEAKTNDFVTALHCAAMQGHLEIVTYLLSQGAAVEAKTNNGATALHWAARNGHVAVVTYLLSQGAAVEAKDNDGWTALHWAAWKGHLDVVTYLRSQGAAVEAKTNGGWTALHGAAANGHLDVVTYLRSQGAAVEAKDNKGVTALHYAANNGYLDMVTYLLSQGAAVEAKTNDGWTALHWAAANGHLDVFIFLYEQGADIRGTLKGGEAVIHFAVASGNLALYTFLRDKVDLNVLTQQGQTVLHMAVLGGNIDIVKDLLAKGQDLHAKNTSDEHTLVHAVQTIAMLQFLVEEKGLDLMAQDKDGFTVAHMNIDSEETVAVEILGYLQQQGKPLDAPTRHDICVSHFAGLYGKQKVLEYLSQQGERLDKVTLDGFMPLHLAASNVHTELVKYLLAHADYKHYSEGLSRLHYLAAFAKASELRQYLDANTTIDLNQLDQDGNTALHLAAGCGEVDSVSLLLKRGATRVVNAQNRYGLTPLHWAAKRMPNQDQKFPIDILLQYLIDEGAVLEQQDPRGHTPLSLAIYYKGDNSEYEGYQFLLRAGASVEVKGDNRITVKEYIETYLKYKTNLYKVYQESIMRAAIQEQEAEMDCDGFAGVESVRKTGLIAKMQAVQQEVGDYSQALQSASPTKLPKKMKNVLKRRGSLNGHYLKHLVADYVAQEEEKQTLLLMNEYPNLSEFYEGLANKLEEIFISYKSIANGDVNVTSNEYSKRKKGIEFLGLVVSMTPIIGSGLLSGLASAAAAEMQKKADKHLRDFAKRCSRLGRLSEITAEINRFALELTIRYQKQILSLQTKEGMKAPSLGMKSKIAMKGLHKKGEEMAGVDALEGMKAPSLGMKSKIAMKGLHKKGEEMAGGDAEELSTEAMPSLGKKGKNQGGLSPAGRLAEYAAFCVFKALQDDEIKPKQEAGLSLSEQFLQVLCSTHPGKITEEKFAKETLPVVGGFKPLVIGDVFFCPGVIDYRARHYVAAHTAAQLYGYRFAKPEEVDQTWQLEATPSGVDLGEAVLPWHAPEDSQAQRAVKELEASGEKANAQAAAMELESKKSREEMTAEMEAMRQTLAIMQAQFAMLLQNPSGLPLPYQPAIAPTLPMSPATDAAASMPSPKSPGAAGFFGQSAPGKPVLEEAQQFGFPAFDEDPEETEFGFGV